MVRCAEGCVSKSSLLQKFDTAKNLCAGCWLLFLVGALYSLGVFNESVEETATTEGDLDGVVSSSMVYMSLLSMPVMLLVGVVLSGEEENTRYAALPMRFSKTQKIRIASAIGSLLFGTIGLGGIGVSMGSKSLMIIAVTLQGIPFAIYYLISLELLAAWSPARPGLAVGLGNLAYGLGTIAFSGLFEYLLERVKCSTALFITGIALVFFSAPSIALLSWPCKKCSTQGGFPESYADVDDEGELISWRKLPFLIPFWHYVLAIFAGQTGYAFIPYFFNIGRSFGMSSTTVIRSYQIAITCSTVFRLLVGVLSDCLKWGNGFFSIGSKNVTLLLFIMQSFSYIALISFSQTLNYDGFVFSASVILMVFAGVAVESAVLARDIFSPSNSSLIFGVGASIAMGIGEVMSGKIMAAVDLSARSAELSPEKYNMFYVIGVVLSIQGFLVCIMLRRYKAPRRSIVTYSETVLNGVTALKADEASSLSTLYGAVQREETPL